MKNRIIDFFKIELFQRISDLIPIHPCFSRINKIHRAILIDILLAMNDEEKEGAHVGESCKGLVLFREEKEKKYCTHRIGVKKNE